MILPALLSSLDFFYFLNVDLSNVIPSLLQNTARVIFLSIFSPVRFSFLLFSLLPRAVILLLLLTAVVELNPGLNTPVSNCPTLMNHPKDSAEAPKPSPTAHP